MRLTFLEGFNRTVVALIPKKHKPVEISDFRPISLCNVVYKLVTNVTTNHLKAIIPLIISDYQSACTPGRLTTDNVLRAFEVFHSMHCHSRQNGSMTINLDMLKACDRVEWIFLRSVMQKLGFSQEWIDLVISCVESATFSFLLNGELRGFVKLSRGLLQRRPYFALLVLILCRGAIIFII